MSHPFRHLRPLTFDGNCAECGGKLRDSVHGATDRDRWQQMFFAELASVGLRATASSPNSVELYLGGFATVQCSISGDQIDVERYYDNELLDVDRHFHQAFPVEETFAQVESITTLCRKLVTSIRSDEPILNFAE